MRVSGQFSIAMSLKKHWQHRVSRCV